MIVYVLKYHFYTFELRVVYRYVCGDCQVLSMHYLAYKQIYEQVRNIFRGGFIPVLRESFVEMKAWQSRLQHTPPRNNRVCVWPYRDVSCLSLSTDDCSFYIFRTYLYPSNRYKNIVASTDNKNNRLRHKNITIVKFFCNHVIDCIIYFMYTKITKY